MQDAFLPNNFSKLLSPKPIDNQSNKKWHKSKMTQTIPSGSDPAFVDWCIISSNWNVFEPGAAHTKTKKNEKSEKTTCISN